VRTGLPAAHCGSLVQFSHVQATTQAPHRCNARPGQGSGYFRAPDAAFAIYGAHRADHALQARARRLRLHPRPHDVQRLHAHADQRPRQHACAALLQCPVTGWCPAWHTSCAVTWLQPEPDKADTAFCCRREPACSGGCCSAGIASGLLSSQCFASSTSRALSVWTASASAEEICQCQRAHCTGGPCTAGSTLCVKRAYRACIYEPACRPIQSACRNDRWNCHGNMHANPRPDPLSPCFKFDMHDVHKRGRQHTALQDFIASIKAAHGQERALYCALARSE